MLTDVQLVILVAAASVATYFLGSIRNRKLMKQYAKVIKEVLDPKVGEVKYRLVAKGFEAVCYPKVGYLEQLHVRVIMADRWNLAHYMLTPVTRDTDKALIVSRANIPRWLKFELVRVGKGTKYEERLSTNDARATRLVLSGEVARILKHLGGSLKVLSVNGKKGYVRILCLLESDFSLCKGLELATELCSALSSYA